MSDNWCVFLISILCNMTPEMSFKTFANNGVKPLVTGIEIEDLKDIENLKKEFNMSEIAEMYCINVNSLYKRTSNLRKSDVYVRR